VFECYGPTLDDTIFREIAFNIYELFDKLKLSIKY
jgi:hypothetical protein